MTEQEPNYSRVGRKKGRNRSNNILNLLIGVVVMLIIIVGVTIFVKSDGEQADEKPVDTTEENVNLPNSDEEQSKDIDDEKDVGQEDGNSAIDENTTELPSTDESVESPSDNEIEVVPGDDSAISVPSDDDVVVETITNTAWQPIGTTQTGEHASQYDGESVDWIEKQQALAYATGLPRDSMLFLKIKNGGSPQKSIGIVSSRDKVEKYRVYLEWVDGQGWKPVKMDVLKTLDFDY